MPEENNNPPSPSPSPTISPRQFTPDCLYWDLSHYIASLVGKIYYNCVINVPSILNDNRTLDNQPIDSIDASNISRKPNKTKMNISDCLNEASNVTDVNFSFHELSSVISVILLCLDCLGLIVSSDYRNVKRNLRSSIGCNTNLLDMCIALLNTNKKKRDEENERKRQQKILRQNNSKNLPNKDVKDEVVSGQKKKLQTDIGDSVEFIEYYELEKDLVKSCLQVMGNLSYGSEIVQVGK